MIDFEFRSIKQLGEYVCWVSFSVHLLILELMTIPYQLHPFRADVNVLHLACSACVLEETLGGCRVDVDDVGLWEWRSEFVGDIPDV